MDCFSASVVYGEDPADMSFLRYHRSVPRNAEISAIHRRIGMCCSCFVYALVFSVGLVLDECE